VTQCLRMAAIAILLGAANPWYVSAPIGALTAGALVSVRLARSWIVWSAIAVFLFGYLLLDWAQADNHRYLFAYTAMLVALALERNCRPRNIIVPGSAYLIGLSMLFATFQKLTSATYVSTDFFRYTLLTDERFANLVHAFSGVSQEQLFENREAQQRLLSMNTSLASTIPVRGWTQVGPLATFLTVWTATVEVLIGACFMLNRLGGLLTWGHGLLLLFIISTYPVATVPGFAWILCSLGAMATLEHPQGRLIRRGYILCFLTVFAFTLPVKELLLTIFG
jgi:hypothetical protein